VRAANEFQIVEDLQAALAQFAEIASDLKRQDDANFENAIHWRQFSG